jgi:O-antigen ligase
VTVDVTLRPVDGTLRLILAPLATVLSAVDAAVRRPSLAVAGSVLLVCLPSQISDVSASGHITAADVAAAGVIAAVVVRMVAGDRVATPWGLVPFAAAIASLALATVTAVDAASSVRGFIRYAELFVLIPVAVAMTLRNRRDVLLVAGSLVATTVLEAAVGGWQYLTKTGASYGGQYIRAVGTFGADQVLALGAVLGYGILVTLALGLAMRGRARGVLVGLAVLLGVPLMMTLSRGAWIATAAAVGVLILVASWRLTAVLAAAAALFTVVILVGGASGAQPATAGNDGQLDQRLTSIVSSGSAPDRSVQDRYALWSTAVAMWQDHPVLGVGLKDFPRYRDSYAPMSLSAGSDVADQGAGFRREPLLSAHNQYLMILAEQGAVGFLAFGGLFGTLTVGSVLRRRRPARPNADADADRFLDLVAPAVMVWTLIDFSYGDIGAGPTGVVLAVLLGLVARRMVLVPRMVRPAGAEVAR